LKYNRNIKGNELRKVDGKFESRYLVDAEYVQQKINEVSPSFCLAKWFNVSIHIPTGKTHSCYHPSARKIPLVELQDNPSALHNTEWKKEQREKMLDGERPAECEFCWQCEDAGNQLSDRAYRSKDVYETGLIEEAIDLGATGNAKPRYVEVNFNQACNFKCAYCSPHLSTEWMKEVKKHGSYKLVERDHNSIELLENIDNSLENPYLEAFWKWLPEIYPTLQTFRMTGGEPLMDKNTFKMFDYVKQNPKKDLHLSITSNCCPPKGQWQKFITSFRTVTPHIDHFMLFCSLDSWGEQAEYIRNGLNFETMLSNVKQYLKEGKKHSLTFIITFNVLSYSGIYEYMQNILKLRQKYSNERQLIWFDIPQLMSPDYMNPKLYTNRIDELHKCVEFMENNKDGETEEFKGFSDFEIEKVKRLINWIEMPTGFDKETAMRNFYRFFTEHDKRRNTNFLDTFPELRPLWRKCERLK
jgi:pyruvate-formate lyase-activating enzyme